MPVSANCATRSLPSGVCGGYNSLVRSLGALSDYDFELLIADLLGEELDIRFELFAAGPDGGIDLRHRVAGHGPHVVQCKHYVRSSFAVLKRAARHEAAKLAAMRPQPETSDL